MIGELAAKIRGFVSLGGHDAVAVALWTVHAYAFDTAFHSPGSALIRSAKKMSLMGETGGAVSLMRTRLQKPGARDLTPAS